MSRQQPAMTALPDADARLFTRYGVNPRTCTLTLEAPPVTLGICAAGTGEPALLVHGITLGAVHWAPLMARLSSVRCVAIDNPATVGPALSASPA